MKKSFFSKIFWLRIFTVFTIVVTILLIIHYFLEKNLWGWIGLSVNILLVLSVPRSFYRFKFKKTHHRGLIYILEFPLAFIVLLSTLGNWRLYNTPYEIDSLIHILSSTALGLLIGFIYLNSKSLSPLLEKNLLKKTAIRGFTAALSGGIIWEFFEKSCDYWLHTAIANDWGRPSPYDTYFDLGSDFLGAIFVILLINFFWINFQNYIIRYKKTS